MWSLISRRRVAAGEELAQAPQGIGYGGPAPEDQMRLCEIDGTPPRLKVVNA
jgi:hypothetical protein